LYFFPLPHQQRSLRLRWILRFGLEGRDSSLESKLNGLTSQDSSRASLFTEFYGPRALVAKKKPRDPTIALKVAGEGKAPAASLTGS
jgi:hypothetical protein